MLPVSLDRREGLPISVRFRPTISRPMTALSTTGTGSQHVRLRGPLTRGGIRGLAGAEGAALSRKVTGLSTIKACFASGATRVSGLLESSSES